MASHSAETKAAVMAALLDGQSVSAAAREFDIPRKTITDWKRQVAEKSPLKKEIGELIMDLLRARLITLKAITDAVDNPEWLEKQEGSSLAVLYGVMDDKTMRQIELLSRGDATNNDNPAKD